MLIKRSIGNVDGIDWEVFYPEGFALNENGIIGTLSSTVDCYLCTFADSGCFEVPAVDRSAMLSKGFPIVARAGVLVECGLKEIADDTALRLLQNEAIGKRVRIACLYEPCFVKQECQVAFNPILSADLNRTLVGGGSLGEILQLYHMPCYAQHGDLDDSSPLSYCLTNLQVYNKNDSENIDLLTLCDTALITSVKYKRNFDTKYVVIGMSLPEQDRDAEMLKILGKC